MLESFFSSNPFVTVSALHHVAAALFVEYFLSSSDSRRGLRATLNPLCTEPLNELFVQGLFGVRQAPHNECIYLQSSTQHFMDSNEIFIELDLTLELTAYEYCAEAILNGRIIVDGRHATWWNSM